VLTVFRPVPSACVHFLLGIQPAKGKQSRTFGCFPGRITVINGHVDGGDGRNPSPLLGALFEGSICPSTNRADSLRAAAMVERHHSLVGQKPADRNVRVQRFFSQLITRAVLNDYVPRAHWME
jgi:hypothetical protein